MLTTIASTVHCGHSCIDVVYYSLLTSFSSTRKTKTKTGWTHFFVRIEQDGGETLPWNSCSELTEFFHAGHPAVTLSLVMLGKFGILAGISVLYIFTGELSPTVIRNTALSSSATFSRVGSSVSPFLLQLGEIFHFQHVFLFVQNQNLCCSNKKINTNSVFERSSVFDLWVSTAHVLEESLQFVLCIIAYNHNKNQYFHTLFLCCSYLTLSLQIFNVFLCLFFFLSFFKNLLHPSECPFQH